MLLKESKSKTLKMTWESISQICDQTEGETKEKRDIS